MDLYNDTRGMYKAIEPIMEINGVQDAINRIGQRFAGQAHKKLEQTPDSMDSSGL